MKRLWVQQTLAFSVVVIIAMSAIVIWINQNTGREFRKYVTLDMMRTSGSGHQAQVLRELAEHYQRGGSWEGVESLLAKGVYFDKDRNIALGAGLTERESL